MKQRFIFQAIALFFVALLILTLTLSLMQKISTLWFWVAAGVCLAVSYALHTPKR